jgi:hypothetical protein
MTETNGNGAGAAYKAQVQPVTEDVEVTNGFVFTMRKRGAFAAVFSGATLPQKLSSGAVDKWIEQGLLKPSQFDEDKKSHANYVMSIVDQVIENSIRPKIVTGEAQNDDEVSVKDISDADLEILFTWQIGGKVSDLLANFSQGPKPDPVARSNRKKQRHAGK